MNNAYLNDKNDDINTKDQKIMMLFRFVLFIIQLKLLLDCFKNLIYVRNKYIINNNLPYNNNIFEIVTNKFFLILYRMKISIIIIIYFNKVLLIPIQTNIKNHD